MVATSITDAHIMVKLERGEEKTAAAERKRKIEPNFDTFICSRLLILLFISSWRNAYLADVFRATRHARGFEITIIRVYFFFAFSGVSRAAYILLDAFGGGEEER